MIITVKTTASIRPTKALSPIEIAKAIAPYVGKTLTLTVDPGMTVSTLIAQIDASLGINSGVVFANVIMEKGVPLDGSKSLLSSGVGDKDVLVYKFTLNL